MKFDVVKVCAGLILVLALLMCSSVATETTWRHSGFEVWGYDINFTDHNISNIAEINNVDFTDSLNENYEHLIFIDGTTIYSKNGSTGIIDYSGIDAGVVIQDTLNDSNYVVMNPGTYSTTTELSGKSGQTIEFKEGATLNYTGLGSALRFYAAVRGDISRFYLINPTITANTANATGINITGGYIFSIIEPDITADIGINIDLSNSGLVEGYSVIQPKSTARTAGTIGILIGNTAPTNGITVRNLLITAFDVNLQQGDDAHSVISDGNEFSNLEIVNSNTGIKLNSGWMTTVNKIYSEANVNHAIYATSGGTNKLRGVTFDNLYIADASVTYGLYFGDILEFDVKFIWSTTPIRLGGDSQAGQINMIRQTGAVSMFSETEVQFYGSGVWSTAKGENRGSTILYTGNTDAVVTHSLFRDPKNIIITPYSINGTEYYISAVNSTTFTISIPTVQSDNLTYHWYAQVWHKFGNV